MDRIAEIADNLIGIESPEDLMVEILEALPETDISAACAEPATRTVPNAVNPTFFRLFILLPFVNCLILNRLSLSIIWNY